MNGRRQLTSTWTRKSTINIVEFLDYLYLALVWLDERLAKWFCLWQNVFATHSSEQEWQGCHYQMLNKWVSIFLWMTCLRMCHCVSQWIRRKIDTVLTIFDKYLRLVVNLIFCLTGCVHLVECQCIHSPGKVPQGRKKQNYIECTCSFLQF